MSRRSAGWGWALIAAATLLAYLPTLRNGFVWDDDAFLLDNVLIKAPDGLRRFWLTTEPHDYWPVTYSTLWAEWRLWGPHAAGYHVTNLCLHILEAGLLWMILRRLRLPGALLAALLFAVHPVNVESVAWIAQRKNLMAMLFFLLSIYFFLRTAWCEKGSGPKILNSAAGFKIFGPDPFYWLSLTCFLLAMLSKGSVAMLPLALMGLLWWRRGFSKRDWTLLAPFFAVSAGLVAVNVWFQDHGAKVVIRAAGFEERMLGAGTVVWFYLVKALWPVRLIFVYPQWRISAGNPLWWMPLVAAIATTAVLGWKARLRLPGHGMANFTPREIWWRGAFFAWAYFCLMLVPVMGFTDITFMKYSLVADHYQHLAIVGVIAFAAAGLACWAARWQRESAHWPPWLAWMLGALLVGALGALTWRQAATYRNSETLYQATLAQNPDCWMAHNNLALLLVKAGRIPEAVPEYREALRLKPDDVENENNLGTALVRLGRPGEAIPQYEAALRLKPDYSTVRFDLGLALLEMGRTGDAIGQFEKVVRLKPDAAAARFALALALRQSGREEEAVAQYNAGLRLKAQHPAIQP